MGCRSFVGGLLLVIRKLNFIVAGFFVVDITGITALVLSELTDEDVVAPVWDVIYHATDLNLLSVQGEFLVEPDLVEWFTSWTKGLEDL